MLVFYKRWCESFSTFCNYYCVITCTTVTEASEPNILSLCYKFSQFIVSLKTSTGYVGLQSAQQLLEEKETVTC